MMNLYLISEILILALIAIVVYLVLKKSRKANKELKEKKEELNEMLVKLQEHLKRSEQLKDKARDK
jgi:uncharacterized protein YoxC